MEAFNAGTLVSAGSFRCDSCGFPIAIREGDEIPECPECGGETFERASLFAPVATSERQGVEGQPEWLDAVRSRLDAPGHHLAFEEDGKVRVFPLGDGWTRIGRSLSAQVRLDDPTVSRRHALVYCDEDGLKILDDRSLNGVFVNGDRVELEELCDGDELAIGRYRVYVVIPSEAQERPRAGILAG